MGLLGGRAPDDGTALTPSMPRRPPAVWARVDADGDVLVVRLRGWRAIWATQRVLRIPLKAVVGVTHDPAVYQHVSTRIRKARRPTTMFKLGAQHGRDGWSFWACGMARNAVLIETDGVRYRFVIAEVADPKACVQALREAAAIPAPKVPKPPTVRSITESSRLRRTPEPPARPSRTGRPRSDIETSTGGSTGPRPSPSKPRTTPRVPRVAPGSSPASTSGPDGGSTKE
jgi:hypothetical protein